MKSIREYLKEFVSHENIQDHDNSLDREATSARFPVNAKGSLYAVSKFGRILMEFNLNGTSAKSILIVDKTDIRKWRKNGKKGDKPSHKLVLKIVE